MLKDVRLDLVPPKRKKVIENLMQLYFYDFTRFIDLTVNEDGLFPEYPMLDSYWNNQGQKFAFLISKEQMPAGFALVDVLSDPKEGDYYLSEFFIMNKYRRSGLGTWAAQQLFDRFPGKWKVTQVRSNIPAQNFWRGVIQDYTNGSYKEVVHAGHGNISQYFNSAR